MAHAYSHRCLTSAESSREVAWLLPLPICSVNQVMFYGTLHFETAVKCTQLPQGHGIVGLHVTEFCWDISHLGECFRLHSLMQTPHHEIGCAKQLTKMFKESWSGAGKKKMRNQIWPVQLLPGPPHPPLTLPSSSPAQHPVTPCPHTLSTPTTNILPPVVVGNPKLNRPKLMRREVVVLFLKDQNVYPLFTVVYLGYLTPGQAIQSLASP